MSLSDWKEAAKGTILKYDINDLLECQNKDKGSSSAATKKTQIILSPIKRKNMKAEFLLHV